MGSPANHAVRRMVVVAHKGPSYVFSPWEVPDRARWGTTNTIRCPSKHGATDHCSAFLPPQTIVFFLTTYACFSFLLAIFCPPTHPPAGVDCVFVPLPNQPTVC